MLRFVNRVSRQLWKFEKSNLQPLLFSKRCFSTSNRPNSLALVDGKFLPSYPLKFPSRNKKENAAEKKPFVSKPPFLPSSIFRARSLIIETERTREREETTGRRVLVSSRVRSKRVLIERTKRRGTDCLTTRAIGGETYLVWLSVCPFDSTSRQSRKRVATLITSFPSLASSLLPEVIRASTSIAYMQRELGENIYISFRRYSGSNVGDDVPRAEWLSSPLSVGQIDVVIVTLHHFFTRLWRNSWGPVGRFSNNKKRLAGGHRSTGQVSTKSPTSYLIHRLLVSERLNAINLGSFM